MSQMCPNCGRDNRDTGKFCAFCNTQLMGLLGMNTMLQKRYQIVGLLGCGGMGAVYLAQDQRLGPKKVAVKENFDTSQQAQQQFQFEAHILANLDHPNLPKVTDHFIEPSGRQYLVMEYVEGEDLESMRQRHPQGQLPRKQVLVWADALLDALTYLHTQPNPVIHRDVKPDNIKITPQGKVKLVDFGIAKIYRPGQVTYTGIRGLGTPGFAPVEQYIGGTDARSDIYSLGGTLYCLLTGQIPPESAALAAGQPLPPPRQIRPDISAQTQQVIFRAMSVNAAQRFQSASEMRQALKGMAPLPTQQPVVRGPAKKAQPWVLLGFGALVVGIVLCVAGYLAVRMLLPTPTPSLPTPLAATTISPAAAALATETAAQPTETPAATKGAAEAPTEASTPASPTDTPSPSVEPTVTPTPVPTFAPQLAPVGAIGEFKSIGEPYSANGITVLLSDYTIKSDGTIQLKFQVRNEGNNVVLLRYQDKYFEVYDDLGNRYDQDEDFLLEPKQVLLAPGKSFEMHGTDWPNNYDEVGYFYGKVPEQASYLIVKVSQFADLQDMQWSISLQ
jgi:predicted Ser/Thr protein kinase